MACSFEKEQRRGRNFYEIDEVGTPGPGPHARAYARWTVNFVNFRDRRSSKNWARRDYARRAPLDTRREGNRLCPGMTGKRGKPCRKRSFYATRGQWRLNARCSLRSGFSVGLQKLRAGLSRCFGDLFGDALLELADLGRQFVVAGL